MGHSDDILRTFISGTNKYGSRFSELGDGEKLTLESLLNYRFRCTTMTYVALTTTLKNIILDKVMTAPNSKLKKSDTNSPVDIGMTATGDSDETRDDEEQRAAKIAVQAVYEGGGHKGSGGTCKSRHWKWCSQGHHFGKTGNDAHRGRVTGRRMEAMREEQVTMREAQATATLSTSDPCDSGDGSRDVVWLVGYPSMAFRGCA